MKKNLYYILYIGVLMMFLAGCQDEGMFTPEEETSQAPVNVSFQVKLGGEEMSRAIGDASRVNQLIVGVFQDEDGKLLNTDTIKREKEQENFTNVTIPMFKNQTYKLAFWAQVENNGIYSIDNNFNINIDYSKYKDISLVGTESFEAFSAIRTGVTVDNPGNASIVLTRPFAQLNIAASEEEIFNKVNKTAFTINKVYTAYNPFSGTVGNPVEKRFSFTFSQSDVSVKQNTTINGNTYYYLASAYLLAPEEVVMIGGLYKDEEIYKALVFNELPLAANTRTNIYGNMIQQEVMQGWDGVTFTAPTNEGSTCNVTIEGATNILHIDTPEELAYCMKNGYPSGYDAIHICANIDMGGHDWNQLPVETDNSRSANPIIPKNVPEGIVIVGTSGEGQAPFTISNAKVSSTGLFGDIKNVTVKNLKLKNIHVEASGNVGVLAGTVTGASIFENVIVEGGSVSSESSDIAGGMVGYINHESVTNQSVATTLSGCQANGITNITGSVTGKLVGEFSGYSYNEVLNFIDCSSDITMEATSFNNVNKSCFIEQSLENDENDLLGRETYCRGIVNFGENRFVPKWDGVRSDITPLIENGVNVIYSPYDVAYYQKKSPSTVTFKTNVDLGSHNFDPIKSITNLDGENHTIYNLKVDMVHDGTGAAFIQSANGITTHKDITFVGADIKNVHNPEIPIPAYGVTNDGGAGNAYAGTLVSHSGGTYTVSNVHVRSGKVYAVCKMGGLVGYVGGNLDMSKCSVDNYTIENYAPGVPNYYTLPGPGYMDIYLQQFQDNTITNAALALMGIHKIPEYGRVNLLQWWYTQGEAGGLIGFVKSPHAVIDNCSVTNTNIKCEGQPDKSVVANVWDKADFDSNNPYVSGKKIFAKGTTDIAGRHVNQFIGDIVSARDQEDGTNYDVTISNYTVSGNQYGGVDASSTNDYNHDYASGKYCEVVGCAYYVGVDVGLGSITLKHVNDYAGKLTFYSKANGEVSKVVLEEAAGQGNNQTWTGGSFSNMQFKQNRDKIGGSFLRPEYGPWYYTIDSEYPEPPAI